MTRFDSATIAAFVDGELDDLTARRIDAAIADDADLADAVMRERELRAKLSAHFDSVLDEPVPDRFAALLGGAAAAMAPTPAPSIDTSFAARLAAKKDVQARRFALPQWSAMAASLVVGLTVGGLALGGGGGAGRIDGGGALVASGGLADALDTQLASAQGAGPAVRVGLSFTDKSGAYCRTFESASLGGIACRDDGAWQLRQTVAGQGGADYRQASAGAIAESAAAMMAGAPLDAAQERAARDKGWSR